jgi:hypothetical protein
MEGTEMTMRALGPMKAVAEGARIPLGGKPGAGKYVLVDAEWAPFLGALSWSLDNNGYAQTSFKAGTVKATVWAADPVIKHHFYQRSIKLHRLLMFLNGHDQSQIVDHINGDTLDCRLINLRPANSSQSARNKKKQPGSTSRYHGVSRHGGGWKAQIRSGGRVKNLGTYGSEEDAALVYNRAISDLPVEDRPRHPRRGGHGQPGARVVADK